MDSTQIEEREKAVYNAYKRARKELYDETPKELIFKITKPAIIERAMTYSIFPWSRSYYVFDDILSHPNCNTSSKRTEDIKKAYHRAKKELYNETPPEMMYKITKAHIIRRAMTFDTYIWTASAWTFNSILSSAMKKKSERRGNDDNK